MGVDHTFDAELTQEERKVVHAFAGAAHTEETWSKIIPEIDTYTSTYLLSDHSPVAFTYTDGKDCTYRILFANTASLLGTRGVQDNKAAFGDNITLEDLHEWSNKLVDIQIEGMIKLINSHQRVLKHAKTWEEYRVFDKNKGKYLKKEGFRKVIHRYYTDVKPKPAVGVDKARYKVLKALSNQVWFESSEDAAEAKHKFPMKAVEVSSTIAPILSAWKEEHGQGLWNKTPTATQFRNYAAKMKFAVPNYGTVSKLFKARPDLGTARRRMAQREFSNRRDSPVMTRLLQEIIDAQDD